MEHNEETLEIALEAIQTVLSRRAEQAKNLRERFKAGKLSLPENKMYLVKEITSFMVNTELIAYVDDALRATYWMDW